VAVVTPLPPTEPSSPSRYQRVREILDRAATGSSCGYQGYGPFWRLPYAEFLEFSLYGVRMIAPGPDRPKTATPSTAALPSLAAAPAAVVSIGGPGGVSGSSAAIAAAVPVFGARSAASGLIKGLRGLAPFDGSQFPRLPWGGQAVPEDQIAFIAAWIDDGCPRDDVSVEAATSGAARAAALARGEAEHPQSTRSINDFRDEVGQIKARKNVISLTPDELKRFRDAIREMRRYDGFLQDERSFNYWARIHANLCQHGWEEFLTWHRIYLYEFEQRLQDIDPAVTLPYWDWTLDDQNWNTLGVDTGTIPEPYRCWLDEEAIAGLRGLISQENLSKLQGIVGQKFDSGSRLLRKAGIAYLPNLVDIDRIFEAALRVNPLWHRFRWPGGDASLIFEGYPRPEDIERILNLSGFFAFGSGPTNNHYFGALENVHNLIHNFSGGLNPDYNKDSPVRLPNGELDPQNGDMVQPGTTAFDPIFWGHHSNVDRLWSEWQKRNPSAGPDNPTSVLPPWTLTVADTSNIANLGYEYVMSSHLFETDSSVALTKFRSAAAGVSARVLANHETAEIRIHRVKFPLSGGCFVRAFLNQPDANDKTPVKDNPNYVGQFAMFSGGCVGGPGHCDPPEEPPRKFDRRHRHHKTPGNIRFDATAAVQRLRGLGATDFHVQLVVLGLDGAPLNNALWIDGVSLTFLD
jgi:tyrosinase